MKRKPFLPALDVTKWGAVFTRLRRFPASRLAAVMLVTLALSRPAFAGPVHDAARDGDLGRVKALINENPDLVLSKDDKGNTPLQWAARWGHKDVSEWLLAHKADVNIRDNEGVTPLQIAAGNGHKDVVELLLAHNADIEAKDNLGHTPLHEAALGGDKGTVEILLAHNADVNARDILGMTPLHTAAGVANREDVAELLLAHNADVNARDNEGYTPLHWALDRREEGMADWLRRHGGHE